MSWRLQWKIFKWRTYSLAQVSWSAKDGDFVASGTQFGIVSGSARSILVAERVALNFMQRMSGIATATKQMVEAAVAAQV